MDIEYQIRSVFSGDLIYKSDCRKEVVKVLDKRNHSTHDVYWVNPISGRVRVITSGKLFVKQTRINRSNNVIQTSLIDT